MGLVRNGRMGESKFERGCRMTHDMNTIFKYYEAYNMFMKQIHAYEISLRKEMESSSVRQGSTQRFQKYERIEKIAKNFERT
mgnify:CR=1 FL=1